VNGVLFTREGLVRHSRLPSINELHGELVSLLSLQSQTSQHLMQLMQLNLSYNLENHSKNSTSDQ